MVENKSGRGLNHVVDVPHLFVAGILQRLIELEVSPSSDPEQLYKNIISRFEYPGTAWPILLACDDEEDWWDFESDWFLKEDEEIASTLVSMGVLHLLDGLEGEIVGRRWSGRVYALTSFGLRFVLACDRNVHKMLQATEAAFEARERAAEQASRL